MTLQTQMVDVPLFGGMDQQTTPELVQPGRMLDVLNGVFAKRGAITKRHGFIPFPTSISGFVFGDTTWATGNALVTRVDELLQIGTVLPTSAVSVWQWLGTWSAAENRWSARDVAECSMVTSESVVADSASATHPGVAYSEAGEFVYCWQTNRTVGGMSVTTSVFRVVDATTGAQIAMYELDGSAPKVAACSGDVVVTYISGSTLNVGKWDSAVRALVPVTTIALATGEKPYDLTEWDTTRVLIGARVLGNVVKTHLLTVSSGLVATFSTGEDTSTEIAVAGNGTRGLITYVTGTPAVRAMGFTVSAITAAPFTVYSGAADQVGAVGVAAAYFGVVLRSTSYGVTWRYVSAANGAVSGTTGPYAPEWRLASKPWAVAGRMYCVLRYGAAASLHPTYVAARMEVTTASANMQVEAALPVATLAPRYAGTAISTGAGLPSVTTVRNAQVVALPVRLQVSGVTGATVFATEGLRSYRLAVCGSSAFDLYGWRYVEAQNATHFAGGTQLAYDGMRNVDIGFPHPPEGVTVTTASTGGLIGAGVYSYSLVYVFTDAQGRIHRSAPSVPVATGTLTGSTNKATLTLPPLTVTWKYRERAYGPNAKIEIYRTLANGTTTSSLDGFYRVDTVDAPASAGVTYVDQVPDSAISDEPQIYTAGGVLESVAPPAHTVIAVARNRVWVNSAEDPDVVWFSRELVSGEPPAFNEALTLAVPGGGPVTGITQMDSRVVIFKADRVFVIYGDGPNDQGVGGAFTVDRPQLVTLGCSETRSIVPTSDGVFFLSPQGLCVLTRSLEAAFVGAAVEDTLASNGGGVTSAVNLASASEIRLSLPDNGAFLVWNTLYDGWTRWLVRDALGAPVVVRSSAVSRGAYYVLGNDGTVHGEDPDGHLDSGTWVTLDIGTPWVRLGSLQGYQRVRRALLLTEKQTSYALQCEVKTDYNDGGAVQSTSFSTADIGDKRQLGIHIAPQTSQAIRFRFTDSAPASLSGNNGQGAVFVGLSLEVGMKAGTNKLAAEARR